MAACGVGSSATKQTSVTIVSVYSLIPRLSPRTQVLSCDLASISEAMVAGTSKLCSVVTKSGVYSVL